MSLIKNDEEYINALTSVSDNLLKFLNCLNRGEGLNLEKIQRDKLVQSDGSVFRIICSRRTAEEQIKIYKQGRKGVKYERNVYLFPNNFVSNTPSTYFELKDRGIVENKNNIASNAWCGESYHNWGLAIDICIRKFGLVDKVSASGIASETQSIDSYYQQIGLLDVAEKCGVEWGGNWSDFRDIAHFQDALIKIPPKEYHYDKNMNITWLKRFYGSQIAGEANTKSKKMGLGSVLGLGLGAVALLALLRKGGKRK